MDLDRKRVHRSIFEAVDRFTQTATWGGGAGFTPAQQRANADHTRIWMSQHGKGCAAWIGAYLLLLFGAVALKPIVGKENMGLVVLAYFVFLLSSMYLLYQSSKQRMSADELRTLAPALGLTSTQLVYTDAILALTSLNLPRETASELWSQLNRLLDEEARLIQIRDRGCVGFVTPESIAEEREELRRKLDGTSDPVSREALARSLEICENRLRASTDLSLVVGRVDAQLEMISQSMRGMRDTLQRLITAPGEHGVSIDLQPLREALDQANRHTTALEAAVSEVRTLV